VHGLVLRAEPFLADVNFTEVNPRDSGNVEELSKAELANASKLYYERAGETQYVELSRSPVTKVTYVVNRPESIAGEGMNVMRQMSVGDVIQWTTEPRHNRGGRLIIDKTQLAMITGHAKPGWITLRIIDATGQSGAKIFHHKLKCSGYRVFDRFAGLGGFGTCIPAEWNLVWADFTPEHWVKEYQNSRLGLEHWRGREIIRQSRNDEFKDPAPAFDDATPS
jgi:hypothetical protein